MHKSKQNGFTRSVLDRQKFNDLKCSGILEPVEHREAVKTIPTSIKEKRIPRAEAPCIPFVITKSNKRKKSVRTRRVTSSSPCLILLMRVERSLLENEPGAS
eukprot:1144675-Pelagomonas_calceolata.AAC.1